MKQEKERIRLHNLAENLMREKTKEGFKKDLII